MRHLGLTAAVVCGMGMGAANAQELLQIDMNGLGAEFSGQAVFDENFTGTLHVYNNMGSPDPDGDAFILDVLIDGMNQGTGGAMASEFAFDLIAEFVDGSIVGGSIMVSVDGDGSENTYSSVLLPDGDGSILDIGGGTFLIGGAYGGGDHWTNPGGTFLGVDISPWGSADGFFNQIELNFAGGGTMDLDTDVDMFFIVPAPGSLALLGMGGLLAVRRRR